MSEPLGAHTDVLDQVAQSLSTGALRMQDIRTLAQRALFELQAGWCGSDLLQLTHHWEEQASPQLATAATSLDRCAARLRAQSTAQREASRGHAAGSGLFPVATLPLPLGQPTQLPPVTPALEAWGAPLMAPPLRGSPGDNATSWKALSPQQQRLVIDEHPEWIGNRDGVDFTARDQANRTLLKIDRGRLVAERVRLEAGLADNPFGGAFTNDDAALDHVKDKLAALAAIGSTLAKTGDRQLLLLDLSAERAQAAIARGNVDTADDVAVLFFGSPGIGISHLQDLRLDGGHAYYIEARQDAVGDLGYFGVDPSHLAGIEHASARASTVADPVTGQIRQLKEVVGHSSYLDDDSTSQYNMSVIVGGVPDQRVHDSGEGLGDVLSWPVPGTYR